MKKIYISTAAILVIGTAAIYLFHDTKPDALTGATTRHPATAVVLPPDGDTYQVLGIADGLKNYVVQYDDTLYRGGEPFAASAAAPLKKYGIRTIISITPTDHERDFCRQNDFNLIEIPFEKTTGLSPADLQQYLQTLKTTDGPFYVHCHGGAHRGGILGVAYRVYVQNWPLDKALAEYSRLGGDLLDGNTMIESLLTAQK
jgi:protein tyrosine phosphatase (PTP) superfamily phosphohydrolase (DUF442 family)